VLGRIIKLTSKVDTVRVLTEIGVPAPEPVTIRPARTKMSGWTSH